MTKLKNRLIPKNHTRHVQHGVSFIWAFTGTMLVASSIVQASDLQIYAVPTAGKKTIVMMLDTSGSMAYTDSGQTGTRLARLKTGMNTFLDSNNPILDEVRVGLGHYSVGGDGKSSRILVKAEKLGPVGSTQRTALKNAVNGLTATGGTPTAHAYAEAAAYLMGTSTRSEAEIQKDLYKKITTQVFDKYECQNSSRPYLNSANNICYQYNTGFSGSYQTASNGNYECTQSPYLYLRNTSRCYNQASGGSYINATRPKVCNSSSYPYLDTTTNRCYQYQNFSGSTQNATAVYLPVDTYYKCLTWRTTDFTNGVQYCGTGSTSQRTSTSTSYWQNLGSTEPSDFAGDGNETVSGVVYSYTLEMQLGPNADSGFDSSIAASKDGLKYISPLPPEADRVSCDGQGVYILSDGAANGTSTTRSTSIMKAALDTSGSGFNCSGGLTDANDPDGNAGGWHCMGEFAKRLFDKTTNPAGVSIQTAFVGFGNDMNSLSAGYVKRACALSSRTQSDRTGNDSCSPGQGSNAVDAPGYGNGGFFTTQSAQGVTDSVIAFINNLGAAPLEPLTTGAISVPLDDLNPSGLQPYGYLRALEPNPQSNKAVWTGNLKKYKVVLTGTDAGKFAAANGTTLVYDKYGAFNTNTKDLWNNASAYKNTSYNDGGIINLGGAYSKVPMPINGQNQDLTKNPKEYALTATPNALRTLFTDVAATGGATLTGAANGTSLLRIPESGAPTTGVAAYVLGKFSTQAILKDFPLIVKQKLLNYLGYAVPLDETATALPSSLVIPNTPNLAMGGSIHSFPIQLTYSGTLDATGKLTNIRSQSVLYGTMDGGLHIVDNETGEEQMVFVPAELLKNTVASKALVKGQDDVNAPVHGLDGAWVADPAYKAQKSSGSGDSLMKARQMNVYGGLRMSGESYYGLDVLDPKTPKLLFRVGRDQSDFNRMGQSWSKPVLTNIRYNNKITRVMIVGGGYDQCYENPRFEFGKVLSTVTNASGATVPSDFPDASCDNRTEAKGNAVYIIDAQTGKRLWWASSSAGADTSNTNMKHSIVSRISAIDRDGDGLTDHLYFGDLGGQVFRADLNNTIGTTAANFGKRVVRLANLATTNTGSALTLGKNPRFYEAPTVTIHRQDAYTFILVGLASGNRSTPLDVYPTIGRDGMLPSTALTDRLVNNVYGVIDRDFAKKNLITEEKNADGSAFALSTKDKTLLNLQKDPQKLTGNIPAVFIGATATKDGWYRSLSSKSNGTETAPGFRVAGGMKAFEEPLAIAGNLIVPVYDPQGTGIAPQNPCLPRVVGETDRQVFGIPFGVYLKSDNTADSGGREQYTGFLTTTTGCPGGVSECNATPIGGGIRGIALVPKGGTGNVCTKGLSAGPGEWDCIGQINPTRWYEKWIK
ncbi:MULTISPECIES: VWA domain-containing protein [unclassified Acinetobacter]|uniref:VWA domain-containing protein n=1 Tax=unclassified Acinetobacter TaxID=196816 RepID=UPI00244D78E8|nr:MULTISPECIES: VWA domain-containing protein [unclassified Acinetobacter]MDH0029831.1 PilC/PilY family type IV pilus protein [Acinetobacter sp. GD04021]MDH0885405.1 PilC/PilY family type IV pilus protein [Acinetobacter sp. GD03873]MDH1081523.1 PilC/PilY family type IV pilus protein [Acinetobacter sp. GD03983]MDH2188696.1 PilC/PilY family type IV pilus protein [Acinetobacter sp. GD03645]MDH2203419.1 PilC/PilY family type IV pilus protein [Acinetobacter sp. GD03647]